MFVVAACEEEEEELRLERHAHPVAPPPQKRKTKRALRALNSMIVELVAYW